MAYRIEVRDRDLRRIGEIDTWISLDMQIEHCDQGSWMLLLKANTPQADLLQQGGGVAVYQDDVSDPIMTGATETFQKYWTVEQHTAQGSVYVGGKTDNKLAYSRLAFPVPSLSIPQQYSSRKDTQVISAATSTALWNEIEQSMGASALSDRRVPGLNTGTAPAAFGGILADTLRYDVIGEKLADWCKTKNIGYRFLYNPNTQSIDFTTYTPRDLSKEIRLSPELGNLREYTWTLTAPSITRAIVACQGDGPDRYIYQKIDTASEAEWGMVIEQFVDRRDLALKTNPANGQPMKATADVTDEDFETAKAAVIEAADAALSEGAKSGNFQIYPIDTDQVKFGRDYFVGDIITIAVDGVEYSDTVRAVTINVDDGGNATTVSPNIGEQGTSNPLNLYQTVFDMRKKLRKLEARM